MAVRGFQLATEKRRAAFLVYLRSVGAGAPCIPWPWSSRVAGTETYLRVSDGQGGVTGAHRWVYEQIVGPIPAGKEVCHSCDNPACVRPSHLWLGTHSDNIRDAYAKGRMHGNTKNHPVGAAHHSTPLTDEDVYRIRRLAADGRRVQSQLAREYGISHTAINAIIKRRSWKHLPEETDQPTQAPATQA